MGNIFEKFDLKNQAVIVTGGAGLLGRQFSKTLAEAGAGVVVADVLIRESRGSCSGFASSRISGNWYPGRCNRQRFSRNDGQRKPSRNMELWVL